jgi:hypothetical protein
MKSTYSGKLGNCVDVVLSKDCLTEGCAVHVTDTKAGARSPILHFTQDEWDAFLRGVKNDEFSLPRLRSLSGHVVAS